MAPDEISHPEQNTEQAIHSGGADQARILQSNIDSESSKHFWIQFTEKSLLHHLFFFSIKNIYNYFSKEKQRKS